MHGAAYICIYIYDIYIYKYIMRLHPFKVHGQTHSRFGQSETTCLWSKLCHIW